MESLFKLQDNLKNTIEKGRTNFKKSPKERITLGYMETRLESLEEQWSTFNKRHEEMIETATITDLKHSYFTSDCHNETEEIYITYKSELKDGIHKLKSVSKISEPCTTTSSNVRLPKISIPSFSGRYSEWTSFRDLFVSLVHSEKGLDNVQKLHYLKGCLTGEAELLLRQIPITAGNYSVCWEQLEQRYNNKRHLANSILQRLFNQKQINTESAVTIKQLLDTTSDCMNAFNNLGLSMNTVVDIIVIYVVSSKLDPETRKQWELKISSDADDPTEPPTLSQFKTFLESRFRALECIEPQKTSGQGRAGSRTEGVSSQKTLLARSEDPGPSGQTKISCEYCGDSHKLCFCIPFTKISVDQRRAFVQSNKICFNCLGGNHLVYQCRRSSVCHICKKKHHTLLHVNYEQKAKEEDQIASSDNNDTPTDVSPVVSCMSTKHIVSPNQVLLATALVKVQTATANYHTVRALLDQGSQASFITEATAQYLRLKKSPVKSVVSGLGSIESTANSIVTLVLKSMTEPSFMLEVTAYVLKNITSYIPERQVAHLDWSELEQLTLADPQFSTPNRIDILLGADVYSKILKEGLKRAPSGSMVAQCTKLGWIVSGVTQVENKDSAGNITVMHTAVDQNDLLKKFWEIEDQVPQTSILTEEELRCEELYKASTSRGEDGRYTVNLPFKDAIPACVNSNIREIAVRRFKALERKFAKNLNLKENYTKVIEEYLHLNHMRRVQKPDKMLNKAAYLPHHAVIREDKSTSKVRVVFDASCKNEKGVSLNDTLMIGPTLQSDLRHIILRWRVHPIALTADIVKMYRQVRVAEDNVRYQRIVWRKEPDEEIQDYELLTVTFGTASAPYLAVKTLHQVALDYKQEFPTASEIVPTSYYMDDLMTGCSTIEEGRTLYIEMKTLLEKAGFELQKWNSNSSELMKKIETYEGKDEKEILNDSTKILGLTWCRSVDQFKYTVLLPSASETLSKRIIISDIARLFDPLGWIAPSLILAKILIQKLWLAGVGWDDSVPDKIKEEWVTYRQDLENLCKVRVPRWLGTSNGSVIELHGFSDASKAAYAAVVYTRCIDPSGNIQVALLTAKTKVAPIKTVSIPRLELCAAVLLTRLLTDVARAMNIPKDKVRAWTDSTVVLAWLNSHPSRWKTFVSNRVSEILTTLEANQWAHVSTKDNPADCASRGVLPSLLHENKIWFHGPQFLHNVIIEYSRPLNVDINLEENIKCHVTVEHKGLPWDKYSSLRKLLRIVALCRIFFYHYVKSRDIPKYIKGTELDEALKCCIRRCQRVEFEIEYIQLQRNMPVNNKSSKISSLCPFLDKDGIIRVGGRLHHASLSDNEKHPIILPHNTHFTKLLIADAHDRTLHGGPQIMINYLRSAYWIIGVKSLAKNYVNKCVICVKNKAKVYNQFMGSLPSSRCTPSRPFLNSGVDYAGPVQIRTTKGRGHRSHKGYICVYVCMSTRAIHLEVVSDMSTQGFLAAFRRFVARRGHCANIWSDNGTNFVGAARELRELASIQQDIAERLEDRNTTWHFIPPHAPNFGGLWESAVKSTKYHLKRVIGSSTLTYEEMSTLLSEIEACLNSRPMTVINGEDIHEPMPLTPGHFLIGEPLVTVPDISYEGSNISSLSRWQHVQKMVQSFWKRWSVEYMSSLVHRYKWSHKTPEPKVGDVVLVKEFDMPPACWFLGTIIEKHPGPDEITRVVTLRTSKGLLKRPTSKLCILPVNE